MLYTIAFAIIILIICYNTQIVRGGYCDEYISLENTKRVKGIAAILIVLHHLAQRVAIPEPLALIRYVGFILVAAFFFFSGYGLSFGLRSKPDYLKHFLKKRILPILIPYWIVNTTAIIFRLIKGDVFSTINGILSYVGIDTILGTWFVTAILIFYIIFWIAYQCGESLSNDIILVLLLCGYCIVCFAFDWHPSYSTASVASFILGVKWYRVEKPMIRWIRGTYCVKLVVCFLVFSVAFLGRLVLSAIGFNNAIVQMLLRNLVGVLFIVFLMAAMQKIQFAGKVVEWLGNTSYELYIVHLALLTGIESRNSNLYVILVIGGSLSISTILWRFDRLIIKRIRNDANCKI